MTCEQIRRDLAAYLTGELPLSLSKQIAAHLAGCPECAGEADVTRSLCDRLACGLKEWVEVGTCPSDLRVSVRAAVRAELVATTAKPKSRVWHTLIAGSIAVVLLGILLLRISAAQTTDIVPLTWNQPGSLITALGLNIRIIGIEFNSYTTVCRIGLSGLSRETIKTLPQNARIFLVAGEANLPLRGLVAEPLEDGKRAALLTVTFGPAPRGEPLAIRIESLAGRVGPWEISLPARPE